MLVQAQLNRHSISGVSASLANGLETSPLPLYFLLFANSGKWVPSFGLTGERAVVRFGTLASRTCSHSEAPGDRLLLNKLLSGLDRLSSPSDSAAFAPVLHSCSRLKALPEGKRVHAHIIRAGLKQDIYLSNCLVTMYGKCGNANEARKVFDEMHHRDVVSWTSMIGAYAHGGHNEEAFWLFQHMLLKAR